MALCVCQVLIFITNFVFIIPVIIVMHCMRKDMWLPDVLCVYYCTIKKENVESCWKKKAKFLC